MKQRKGSIVFAILLILLGLGFTAVQLSAPLRELVYAPHAWPYQIIGVGALLALVGLLAWVPGLLIPAAIIAGIGGILFYQNLTGDWASWAYAWTLIPGFVAVGLLLYGLLKRRRGALIGAGWTLFSSLVLFGIFGSAFGQWKIAGQVWPVMLILLGLLVLIRPRRRSNP